MRPYQTFAQKNTETVLALLGSSAAGLSTVEALQRMALHGPNEIKTPPRSVFTVLGRQLGSVLTGLLAAAAAIAFALSEPLDGITIVVILVINTGLGFVQEYRSEQAVHALRSLTGGMARVRRGGSVVSVPRRDIVSGDLVLLVPGDISPADLRMLSGDGALVDESVLSGESEPAGKRGAAATDAPRDYAAAEQIVFSGTTVVSGELEGVVFATGLEAEFGRISALALSARRSSTFETNIKEFSRFIGLLVGLTLAVLFVAKLIVEGDTARVGELLLFSLALAISVVPEALPVVMTITFSRGALHLARRHVVVKRLSAIEDLGHIEILCTDKTGTITENKMRVAGIFSTDADRCVRVAGESAEIVPRDGELANPFDRAVWQKLPAVFRESLRQRTVLATLPFNHLRRRSATVLLAPTQHGARLLVKGAPEVVLERSGHQGGQALTAARREEILRAFSEFGRKGYRVLGIAESSVNASGPWDERDEQHLEWLGLIAFEDPLKPSAHAAIKLAERLHVRVKILTGDAREVAGAVATEVGIVNSPDEVITGTELDALDAAGFNAAAERYDVFSRVTPEQKYRLISALQRDHSVGFLGEGVNDAPALKLADVALTVPSAADISREIADALLLDRSLKVIVDGIHEGRAIVANVAKYIRYTLAGNFGNFLSIATISLFLPYLPMLPVQILLTNLLTDLPLISLAADRVDAGELDRPRRLHIREIVFSAMLLGLVSAVFDLIFFGLYRAAAPAVLQTLWFIFSILSELATIFVIRTALPVFRATGPSRALVGTALAAAAVSVALPFFSFGRSWFHFVVPLPRDLGVIVLLVLAVVVMTEIVKRSLRTHLNNN